MSDNKIFDPEKLEILEFKYIKGQVDTPEDFDADKVEGNHLSNSIQLGFNIDEKLIKSDIFIEIKTDSKGGNKVEAIGSFHFVYIFRAENLLDLLKIENENIVELNPGLSNALSSITYSTSRGILLTRLQGTALQKFILPVVNPDKLLNTKQ